MARPRPVRGVKAGGRLAPNARRVLAVRIGEVYQYDGDVADPANVTELHDMRIACKRLRYLLEIFGAAFTADLSPFVDEVKALQDVLGDIHDCDVQVPMLEEHLRWLNAREGEAVAAVLADGPLGGAPPRGAARVEAAYMSFRDRFDGARRADERPGLHTLIAMRRARRDVLYAEFIERWRRLKKERFRARLEDALGIG
ncbi:MAG: CHAD domain-containing protein [Thermoleophilia bacterium]|nr:CHAD domain-containing protein [Thermoleophilia bacterium]